MLDFAIQCSVSILKTSVEISLKFLCVKINKIKVIYLKWLQ